MFLCLPPEAPGAGRDRRDCDLASPTRNDEWVFEAGVEAYSDPSVRPALMGRVQCRSASNARMSTCSPLLAVTAAMDRTARGQFASNSARSGAHVSWWVSAEARAPYRTRCDTRRGSRLAKAAATGPPCVRRAQHREAPQPQPQPQMVSDVSQHLQVGAPAVVEDDSVMTTQDVVKEAVPGQGRLP